MDSRSIRIDTPTYEEIERVLRVSWNNIGTWYSIIDQGLDCKIKYKSTSTVHNNWTTGLLVKFITALKKISLDRNLPKDKYMIGKLDLLIIVEIY